MLQHVREIELSEWFNGLNGEDNVEEGHNDGEECKELEGLWEGIDDGE